MTVLVEMQILQIEPPVAQADDDAGGDARLLALITSDAVARQPSRGPSETPAPMTIVASELLLHVGEHRLTMRDGKLRIDQSSKADEGAGSPPWKVLAAPRLLVYLGQQASITVGRQVPYMVKREDGSLVVDSSEEVAEGIAVHTSVQRADDGMFVLEDTRVKISRVTGRVTIDDVPFDVGRPVISSQETAFALKLSPEQVAVVQLPRPNQNDPTILVFLSVKEAKP